MLASRLSPVDLIVHLQQRRAQLADHQPALERMIQAMDEGMDLGERLARDCALAVATAELAWLDRTPAQLSQQPLFVEAAPGDLAGRTV